MRPPVRRRARVRSALHAAAIPTWAASTRVADTAESIRFIRAPGNLPRGRRVYAIGDVHGHPDKLIALHRAVAEDFAARPTHIAILVHLGDYIDQGPDSAGVLNILASGPPVAGMAVVNLLGDHERMLVAVLVLTQGTLVNCGLGRIFLRKKSEAFLACGNAALKLAYEAG